MVRGDPDNNPFDQLCFLSYTIKSLVGYLHTLHTYLCHHWGAVMFTVMLLGFLYNTFKPFNWIMMRIQTLQEYTYSQWTKYNILVHGVILSSSRVLHRVSLTTQITGS